MRSAESWRRSTALLNAKRVRESTTDPKKRPNFRQQLTAAARWASKMHARPPQILPRSRKNVASATNYTRDERQWTDYACFSIMSERPHSPACPCVKYALRHPLSEPREDLRRPPPGGGGPRSRFRSRRGRVLRIARPQRSGQDHHD